MHARATTEETVARTLQESSHTNDNFNRIPERRVQQARKRLPKLQGELLCCGAQELPRRPRVNSKPLVKHE